MPNYIDADVLINNKFKNDISYNAFVNLVKRQQIVEEKDIVTTYCKERKLVMITEETFEVLKSYYDRQNGF